MYIKVIKYCLQISPPLIVDTETIEHLALNVDLGRYVLTGLNHDTHYQFKAVLVNAAGKTANFTDETNTTIGEKSNYH